MMTTTHVKISVSNLWEKSEKSEEVRKLEKYFCEHFDPRQPEYYVKVPGRVNLIGEHVDYCGYSVLPMAIKQCVIVVAKRVTNEQTIQLINLNSERYENVTKNISDISKDSLGKSPCWSNYFFCGVKGARDYLNVSQLKAVENIGFMFAVSGNIPEGSGLSSSSALVTAAVMATLVGYGVKISRLELAEISAKCERYIGTAGGGMDQAIAVNAKKGYATRIDFNPLTVNPIELPSSVKFVVAQSLVVKNKAESNDFNTRVVECRIAAQMLAKQLNLKWEKMTSLAAVHKAAAVPFIQMIKMVHRHLRVEGYTKKQVCDILSVTEDELAEISLTPNTINVDKFFLHQRALHVFEEAKRMEMFVKLSENPNKAKKLGQLMDESHASLRDLYQCSHSDLENLVDICKMGGAYGCKITGAGWGGCVVAMVNSAGAQQFVELLADTFYAHKNLDGKSIDQLAFVTSPREGACVKVKPDAASAAAALSDENSKLPALQPI